MPDQEPKPKPRAASEATSRAGSSPLDEGKGAYKYLPIECPNCGFQGKVNISRLDQTFHCKECNQVFHVSRDGTVAGERPAEGTVTHASAPVSNDKPLWVEEKFRALPAAAKWAALGVALVIVAVIAVKMMQPETPLPGDLDERAALAAKAFGKGDWKMLKRLAKPSTAGALGEWLEKARPAEWEDLTAESKIDVKLGKQEKVLRGYDKTKPILDARIPADIHPVDVTGPEATLTVPFFWSQDKKGDWWLDGEKMLENSKPVKTAGKQEQNDQDEAEDAAEEGGASSAPATPEE